MSLLLAQIWPYLLGAAALVAGWFAARQSGISAGKEKVRREQADATSEQRRKVNEADTKLAQMDDSDIRRELRKWVRPDTEDR